MIDQRYRLEKPVGRGGMSIVWRAEHLALQAPVALKLGTFVASSEAEAESRVARFRREARSLARIRSPPCGSNPRFWDRQSTAISRHGVS